MGARQERDFGTIDTDVMCMKMPIQLGKRQRIHCREDDRDNRARSRSS